MAPNAAHADHGPMRPLGRLISFAKARRHLAAAFRPTRASESVRLAEASGRVAARPVRAKIPVPAFDRSMMDGYAIRSTDVRRAGARLKLVGAAHAGQPYRGRVARGTCVQIATGAPLPRGADTVIKVEDTRRQGRTVECLALATKGEHVGRRGGDVRPRTVIARANELLTPARLGPLAAQGLATVRVWKRPRIGLLSTGTELRRAGDVLQAGQVYDSNTVVLRALLEGVGASVVVAGPVPDRKSSIRRALQTLASCDAVLATGSSSAGERDYLVDVLRHEATMVFHGVNVRPGKPLFLARWGRIPVVGLAGNPASCFLMARTLVAPLVAKLQRRSWPQGGSRTVLTGQEIRSPTGKWHILPVRIRNARCYSTYKASDSTTSVFDADGFIEIPERTTRVRRGARVLVHPFQEIGL